VQKRPQLFEYDGFVAEVKRHDGDELLHGVTVGSGPVLHFAGADMEEVLAAFMETFADYRRWCAERNA